jgi:hypothetical protein
LDCDISTSVFLKRTACLLCCSKTLVGWVRERVRETRDVFMEGASI